jgi:hypothetical protein
MELQQRESYEDGWVMFSGAMIFFVGLWNVVEGGIALFRSAFFTSTPIFGNLAFWAFVWIAIGVIEMAIAYAIINGNNIARWFAIVVVALASVVHMLSLPTYPWWSLFVLSINLLIIYGLLVHWKRAEAY